MVSTVDSICKSFAEGLPGNDTEHLSLFCLDTKGRRRLCDMCSYIPTYTQVRGDDLADLLTAAMMNFSLV